MTPRAETVRAAEWAPDRRDIDAIVAGKHGDPFAVLGPHTAPGGAATISVFHPEAATVDVVDAESGQVLASLEKIHQGGFFFGRLPGPAQRYRLKMAQGAHRWEMEDAYAFPSALGDLDIYLLAEGTHTRAYDKLGAHPAVVDGMPGVAFSVWAPNARRVSVVGSFNGWDGRRNPMRKHPGAGIWDIFIPRAAAGDLYKYELIDATGHLLPAKADPFGQAHELPPSTASRVPDDGDYTWQDADWMARRAAAQDRSAPISIYEVHLASWRRGEGDSLLDYDRIADELIPYITDLGFTHVELMPVAEHPFGGSWGYQPIGLFSPTARFGPPEAFARFVDRLHQAGIGVLIDWVPAHFPSDPHGLARFDGTALYEHQDPRRGFHKDWNTLIYNYGRREVSNFLEANAHFWLERYHADGLRVDAVASMLYLDYSRNEGEWEPNRYGGRENLEAIAFIRRMNTTAYGDFPGIVTIAEESTAWPQVSRPVDGGGLGFGYKWNMGWMHDTLKYIEQDPVHRKHHHDKLTFGLLYAWDENFILPISHDEVVHGKGSLIGKMPGDTWQKFANMRAYLAFMWTHPGKKLLFMGCEFAQYNEWSHDHSLDWHLLDDPAHKGVQSLVRDLNALYRGVPALHELDCESSGFAWVDGGNADDSVLAYLRKGRDGTAPALVICNFTPVVRTDYRIGVPSLGAWRLRLTTDAEHYGGSGVTPGASIDAENKPWHGQPHSISVTLPPLSVLVFTPQNGVFTPRDGGR
ncbi:1,4-alpha-glucan branching protein GlgB [Hyphomicrobium sp.]|uniref:1,4-alpha-glucan branching protein GlgB n=1 Tax=Hyphomicrobium sp. TaxID=82 RepID=UPI003F708754